MFVKKNIYIVLYIINAPHLTELALGHLRYHLTDVLPSQTPRLMLLSEQIVSAFFFKKGHLLQVNFESKICNFLV